MCALASLRLWEAVDSGDFLAARRLLLLASNIDARYPLVRVHPGWGTHLGALSLGRRVTRLPAPTVDRATTLR